MKPPTTMLSVVIVFMRIGIYVVSGELTDRPQDTYALVNESTYFNCSTTIRQDNIHWYHYRVGEDKINYVYYKGEVNKQYGSRYTTERDTESGSCNLKVSSVEPQDAGTYVCQDDGGLGTSASAQLIVLDASPTCSTNAPPGGAMGPNNCGLRTEDLQLSCSLTYHGNIPPILEWVRLNGIGALFGNRTTVDNRGKRVTVNLTLKADASLDRSDFLCRTKQSSSTKYECNTGPLKINYAISNTQVMNITLDDVVNCSANTNQICQYRWFHGNDVFCPVACKQTLKATTLGIHKCEAKCQINGTECTLTARTVQVVENASSDENTETIVVVASPTAVIILSAILAIVVLAILTAAAACWLRKKRRRPKDQQQKELAKTDQGISSTPNKDVATQKLVTPPKHASSREDTSKESQKIKRDTTRPLVNTNLQKTNDPENRPRWTNHF